MKILLDECLDRRISKELVGYSVTTVPRQGWAGIKNGQLIKLAEKEFDVFVTEELLRIWNTKEFHPIRPLV